ncbi:response regulator [Sporocytophaga myxococcoides]|uniref:response regulator n=1 Tax=Sporocytophaga myxococcoides TaxID=153721 RepID=UPI000422D26D|nr:response regulator [Sporocytophaga myxococcoides]
MTEDTTLDILLIEDEMSSTLLTERLKREFREKVNIHRNGHTIAKDLDIYTGKDLDIVILDEQYSDLNIIDAVKLIKKRKPEADIIVLTNEKEKALIDKVKLAGAFDYVVKDKSTVDKVVYAVKGLWGSKFAKTENLRLKASRKSSRTTVAILVILFVLIIAGAIYYFTQQK